LTALWPPGGRGRSMVQVGGGQDRLVLQRVVRVVELNKDNAGWASFGSGVGNGEKQRQGGLPDWKGSFSKKKGNKIRKGRNGLKKESIENKGKGKRKRNHLEALLVIRRKIGGRRRFEGGEREETFCQESPAGPERKKRRKQPSLEGGMLLR